MKKMHIVLLPKIMCKCPAWLTMQYLKHLSTNTVVWDSILICDKYVFCQNILPWDPFNIIKWEHDLTENGKCDNGKCDNGISDYTILHVLFHHEKYGPNSPLMFYCHEQRKLVL